MMPTVVPESSGLNTPSPDHAAVLSALDSLAEARSRQILSALLSFADGDFQARLPVDWPSTDGRIAEAFNQTIGQAARFTDEVARLNETVGKEGRLAQRISVPAAQGSWAAQVVSLNTLVDDLVRPTAEIARTIGAVAKGDLGQAMELEAAASRRNMTTGQMLRRVIGELLASQPAASLS